MSGYRVVYVEPGKPAVEKEIGTKLEDLQEAVGGLIECIYAHNAVIQEALEITPYFRQWADAGQRLRTEEEQPSPESRSLRENGFASPYQLCQQKKSDDGDDDSAILEEQRPAAAVDESEKMNPIEPVYIPSVARSVSALMAQLTRLFQEQDQRREKNQHQQMDRKQRREIDEKKQAMGIRD